MSNQALAQIDNTPQSKLSPVELSFCNYYLSNGFNGTQAYLSVKPHVTYDSATVTSSRLLGLARVQDYIHSQVNKRSGTSSANIATIEDAMTTATRIMRATEQDKPLISLAAVKEIRAYHKDNEQAPMDKYIEAMSKLMIKPVQVNVQVNQGDSTVKVMAGDETVDIEPVNEHDDNSDIVHDNQ